MFFNQARPKKFTLCFTSSHYDKIKKNVTENALPQWSINLFKCKICDNSSSEFKKSVYDLT